MTTAPITDFDPTLPEVLADPYPHLDALRESTPVAYSPAMDRYLVSSHESVFACQRNPKLARTYDHMYTDEEFGQEPRDPRWSNFWQAEKWSLLQIEPPSHTRLRSLVSKAFNPKQVLGLRGQALKRSEELLLELRERPQFDLITDYAEPYSVSIISSFLGADRAHETLFLDWAHAMVRMFEVNTPDHEKVAADQASADFIVAAQDLVDYKRKSPGDDLISKLVEARVDGEGLTDEELVSLVILVLNAGHEAVVNTTGNGLTALMRHPDQWNLVTSGQVPARQAVEEMIRWDPPLQMFERWVMEEGVEVDGISVPFGARIAMLYGAANRDPKVFERPGEFDVTRTNASQHINFGGGVHACVGSPLARVELEATVSNFARLVPDLHLVAEPVRDKAFVIWGYNDLKVASAHRGV